MKTYTVAEELLAPGETGLILFTEGDGFMLSTDGHEGSTQSWLANPIIEVERLIVYYRAPSGANLLYTALPVAFVGPDDDGRYNVYFTGCKLEGWTDSHWPDFIQAPRGKRKQPVAQNPVRYKTKPERTNPDETETPPVDHREGQ